VYLLIPPRTYIIVALAGLIVLINSILCECQKDTYEILHNRNIVLRWGVYLIMIVLIWMSFTCTSITGGFMYANF